MDGQPHTLSRKRTGSIRGPRRAGVHPPERHQAPVMGVPAIKCPALCFGGSTTTLSQTMRFAVCPLTQDRTILNSSVSYPGRVSPEEQTQIIATAIGKP